MFPTLKNMVTNKLGSDWSFWVVTWKTNHRHRNVHQKIRLGTRTARSLLPDILPLIQRQAVFLFAIIWRLLIKEPASYLMMGAIIGYRLAREFLVSKVMMESIVK